MFSYLVSDFEWSDSLLKTENFKMSPSIQSVLTLLFQRLVHHEHISEALCYRWTDRYIQANISVSIYHCYWLVGLKIKYLHIFKTVLIF
jgi:hypothetical protein